MYDVRVMGAAIFDNLHMLHDNIDDILSRPDLYPAPQARREAILRVLPIYLHGNHSPEERFSEYEVPPGTAGHGSHGVALEGPRPPSAARVLRGPRPGYVHQEH